MLSRFSVICLIAAATAVALAAQPTVNSVSPGRNAVNAAATTNVSADFSTNMGAPTGSTFRVWSNLRGWLGGSYSGGGTGSLSLDPSSNLLPGEKIQVILTSGLQDTSSNPLTGGYQWQFDAESSAGPGTWDKRSVPSGQYNPFDVAFGDIDGDGDIDMITAGGGNVGYDKKCINDGNGNFTTYDIAYVADGSYCCALADMDNDGDLDAIIGNHPVNTGGNTISAANRIHWNDGNGNFYSSSTFGTSTDETIDLDVGDVDGDGDIDIVTANGTINGQNDYVYFNDGNGNLTAVAFSWIASSNIPVSDTAWSIKLADVDGDGDLDAIVGICGIITTADNIIYLNDGAGNFNRQNSFVFESGAVIEAIATGDFDGDGDLDIICGGNGLCPSSVYFNDGNANFTAQQWDASSLVVYSLTAADMDADGDLDVLVGCESGTASFIMFNNGSGAFSSGAAGNKTVGTGTNGQWGMAVADVDGDNDLDVGMTDAIAFNGSGVPAFNVTANGNALMSGDTVQVANNASVASAALSIGLSDPEGDQISVSATISNSSSQGFAMSEWTSGAAYGPYTLTPGTGTFNVSNITHDVVLTATDGVETATFILHIDVGTVANAAPVISLDTYNGAVANGGNINVAYNSKLSALGMAITVNDADNDNVAITAELANANGMGFGASSFTHAKAAAPYTYYPWYGTFNQQGVVLSFLLKADDGVGGVSDFRFTITISTSGNWTPTYAVTSNGNPVNQFDVLSVNYGATLASLNLQVVISDLNNDNVTMSAYISNVGSTGLLDTEFQQNGATPITLNPASGTFNSANTTHYFTMYVDDGPGATVTFKFYVEVGPVTNSAPVISVSGNAGSIGNGATVNVNHNDTLASLGLAIQVTDANNDNVVLTGTVSNTGGTGILNSQFSNNATAPYTLNPSTGVFNQASTTHTVSLTADDGNGGSATLSFNIVVASAANNPPAISVSGSAGSIGNGSTVNVSYNDTLASLGLAISVTDADNDSVSLTGTVSNTTGTGILNSQFSNTATAPYTVNPSSGTFNQASTTHVVSLSVDDGYGGTASFSFSIAVGAAPNNPPAISVSGSAGSIGNGATINVNYNDTLASLGLTISVADADNDSVVLTGTVSNIAGTGILNSQFSNTATAPYTVNPSSGTFNQASTTHVVSLSIDDGNGGTASFGFSISVGAAPNNPPAISVSGSAGSIGNGATINVNFNDTLASLGLTISVTDADNDSVVLTGTVSNTAGTGILNSQFSNTATAPYTVSPTAGTFNQGGVTHSVSLSIDDGNGGTASMGFDIVVGPAPAPSIEVYETVAGGVQINPGSAASGNRNFGSQLIAAGQTAALTVVIHNAGNANLAVNSVTISGADAGEFVLATGGVSGNVSANGSTSFTVAFDPNTAGSKVATIEINHNDGSVANPFTFEVAGIGTTPAPAPIIVVSENGNTVANGAAANGGRAFGSVTENNPAGVVIMVTNAGNANLVVGSPTLSGPDASQFSISGTVGTLAPGTSATFTVTYLASSVGSHNATVSFTHNDTSTTTPFSFAVSGTTTAAGGTSGGGSGGSGGCVAGSGLSFSGLLFLFLLCGLAIARKRRLA